MRHALLISGLLFSGAASAEEPTPPPVLPTEEAEPALPSVFLDKALKVDTDNRITQGRAQRPLSHRELFRELGRTDLLSKSDELARKRIWLVVSSVAVGTASIVAGSILIATGPNLASVACESSVQTYNEICVPRSKAHNISGVAIMATGVTTALILAGFAFNTSPNVLDRDETVALVSTYNSQLARRLRRPPEGLRLIPMVTPDGASLTASLRF